MPKGVQGSVSDVVWPWRIPAAAPRAPTGRSRIVKAVVQAAVMGGVALLFLLYGRKPVMAGVVAGMAALMLALAAAAPGVFDAIERGLARFGQGVGVAFTYLLLVPFFYLVFLPARLLLAAGRRDILHLRFDRARASYWIERPAPDRADIHLSRPY